MKSAEKPAIQTLHARLMVCPDLGTVVSCARRNDLKDLAAATDWPQGQCSAL